MHMQVHWEELLEKEPTAVETRDDISFQKKIMPWEMMLQSDIDLTKSLVQHNVSNTLILTLLGLSLTLHMILLF